MSRRAFLAVVAAVALLFVCFLSLAWSVAYEAGKGVIR